MENCVRYRWPATKSYRYSEVVMRYIGQPEGSRGWVQPKMVNKPDSPVPSRAGILMPA
jgi:hypothetical protein